MDNELHELSLRRKSGSSSKRSTPSSHTPVPGPSSTPDVVPMEVDAMRRGPLSAEEKDRRRRNNLCMYCGAGEHFANNCPNKSTRAKAKDQKANPSGKA